MIKENLKLSIVTPNLNGGKYIEQTIKSVINQNYKNIEYIIVDGGSTDNSHAIIKKYLNRVKHFVVRKDKNMYEAINHGFSLARGDILTWINSDDFYYDNCLKSILKKIEKIITDGLIVLVHRLVKAKFQHTRFLFIFHKNILLKEDVTKVILDLFLKNLYFLQKNYM